ncbi:MAG: hypothetical protein MR270_01835 [Erysipelotrichaceae bacterium]|nr:hypothetical protein [Erysipelotrichaceae bacterium]
MAKFKKWLNGEEDIFNKEVAPYKEEEICHFIETKLNESVTAKEKQTLVSRVITTQVLFYLILSSIAFLLFILVLVAFSTHLSKFGEATLTWNYVSRYYIDHSLADTKAINSITGMILDYRAFDTLCESFVLFSAITCVFVLLSGLKDDNLHENKGFVFDKDPIVKYATCILLPMIFIFGVYVVLNGHLSPGGGFSGGAIIGAGLILFSLAFGDKEAQRFFKLKTFKTISAIALLGYSLVKCYSFFMGGMGIFDPIHHWFFTFADGSILSGGYILILNICVGAVVSCTMYGFYCLFKKGDI